MFTTTDFRQMPYPFICYLSMLLKRKFLTFISYGEDKLFKVFLTRSKLKHFFRANNTRNDFY